MNVSEFLDTHVLVYAYDEKQVTSYIDAFWALSLRASGGGSEAGGWRGGAAMAAFGHTDQYPTILHKSPPRSECGERGVRLVRLS